MRRVLFHIDDDVQVLEKFERIFKSGLNGQEVMVRNFETAHEFRQALGESPEVDIFLVDVFLKDGTNEGTALAAECRVKYPNSLIFMCSNANDIQTIRSSLKGGANDFIAKDSPADEIIGRIVSSLLARQTQNVEDTDISDAPAGASVTQIKDRIPQIINSAVNCVYILGESGTGKEVIAELFQKGLPKNTPFIKVNCGAISQSLLASELFGYQKGAFTGANQDRSGLIEAANNGWIFLDEIATLPIDAQVSLLRAIDSQAIRRIGSNAERKINFRVISATNESLSTLVEQGKFRRDLWQRLREVQINLPPLRDRVEEIPTLVNYFCQTMRGGPYQLSPNVMNILSAYTWHEGNIRELRNCMRAMTEKSTNNLLTPNCIPEHIWEAVETNKQESRAATNQVVPPAENTISVTWQGEQRPRFELLSAKLLLAILQLEYEKSGQMSLRMAAKAVGVSKSSMRGKVLQIIDFGLATKDELGKLLGYFDE